MPPTGDLLFHYQIFRVTDNRKITGSDDSGRGGGKIETGMWKGGRSEERMKLKQWRKRIFSLVPRTSCHESRAPKPRVHALSSCYLCAHACSLGNHPQPQDWVLIVFAVHQWLTGVRTVHEGFSECQNSLRVVDFMSGILSGTCWVPGQFISD